MNRIDKVVVFRSLKEHHLRAILDLELQSVQDRIMMSAGTKFVFQCTNEAKEMLLHEGIDYKIRYLSAARALGNPRRLSLGGNAARHCRDEYNARVGD